jgi:hypothetical protein
MRRKQKAVAAAWIAAAVTLTASQAPHAAEPLSIRIYDSLYTAHRGAVTLTSARAVAGAILAEGGVDTVMWRDCSTGCADPVQDRELIVRIVRAPAGTAIGSLGCAVIDLRTGVGTLATIYGDRVGLLAARTGVVESTLLGRVIAHEIGHLLGTSQHAAAGLMRAQWTDRELQNNIAADWGFGK